MLENLPSASGRKPLASGRAVIFAVFVHVAVGAAIYAATASAGSESPGGDSGTPAAPVPAEPQPSPRTAAARDAGESGTAAQPDVSQPKSAGQPQVEPAAGDLSTKGKSGAAAPATPSGPERTALGDSAGAPGLASGESGAAAGSSESPLLTENSVSLSQGAGGAELSRAAGGIVIDAPDTMRLGESYEVRIALPPPVPAQPARAAGDTVAARPRRDGISPVRQAVLAGENLLVEPRTAGLQLADSASPSVWRWMVTPIEPGRQRLAAEISIVHYREGTERIASLRPSQKEVHVSASTAQEISRFFGAEWPWLGILLLIASVGWLRARSRGGPARAAANPRGET